MSPRAPADSPRTALVVEDRPTTADALVALVAQTFPGIAVRRAGSVADALAALAEGPPELALIDLGLPDGSGLRVIERLTVLAPEGQRIVTTIFADDVHLFPALRAGATGYLLKDQPLAALGAALQRMLAGEPPLSPSIARRLLGFFAPTVAEAEDGLTPRERETLVLIAKGLHLPEVAEQLGVTRHTAAGYIKAVYRKLKVSSRAEATLEAVRRGLVGTGL